MSWFIPLEWVGSVFVFGSDNLKEWNGYILMFGLSDGMKWVYSSHHKLNWIPDQELPKYQSLHLI